MSRWDAAVVGGGLQYDLTSRVAIRADAQVVSILYYPVGTRASVGVTIPLGRYDTH